MKITYQAFNFSGWKLDMIEQVNAIVEEYRLQGYPLTLRQVYYQFVARDLLPERWADPATGSTNNERSYKNLGQLINDGRMAGLISWDAIEDRTRALAGNGHWDSPSEIIEAVARQYQIDKWQNQDTRVEIWVEKDALEGVVERAARALDVNYFSCRGYTSQTSMHDAARRLERYIVAGQNVVLLHLGDHDPSGMDMSRDIEDRLKLFLGKRARELDMRRIALNMDQIQLYNPPPNPAKVTDSRAVAYIKNYGEESWELDALEPTVINQLITNEVNGLRNNRSWRVSKNREDEEKKLLGLVSEKWDDIIDSLDS